MSDSLVLVTGGAGFIGSHLCDRLIAAGRTVLCLDNFRTGSRRNVAGLAGDRRFRLVEADVVDPFDCRTGEIFNLACPASPVHYQADPLHTLKTCFIGSLNVLELAQRNGARIFQASTSEVYGDPTEHPQREEYRGNVNPIGPRACYDEGKRVAETLFFDHRRRHGTAIKVGRIFNTYGPRMQPDDGRVVSNFIVQALRGDPLTVYGKGSQTRSFCYVSDLVEAILRLMASDEPVTGPVNIGNDGEMTVRQLAELVLELTGSRSTVIEAPLPDDDPTQRQPDLTRARTLLDWRPQVKLRDGLAETIAWFRHALAA
jgi:UDP-glucuronate decarboxylase